MYGSCGAYMVMVIGNAIFMHYLPQTKPLPRKSLTIDLHDNIHNVNDQKPC